MKELKKFCCCLLVIQACQLKLVKPQNLNILGLLETRALDFKRVIITSVNEGIMPAGKTFNSLIPQVLKLKYGMFGYSERDKILATIFTG